MLAGSLIDAAALLLQDVANIHWSRAELLSYLNAAQAYVVAQAPEAYTLTQDVTATTAGQTQFQLSTTAVRLVEIYHNTAGAQSAVQRIERSSLETTYPGWRTGKPALEAKHYAYDWRHPKMFWVYPPLLVGSGVRLACSMAPPTLTTETDSCVINDLYRMALIHYMLYSAYLKDAEVAANADRAKGLLEMCDGFIKGKRAAEQSMWKGEV